MPYRHCATRAGNYLQTTARDLHSPYSQENLRERESSLSADSPFVPALLRHFKNGGVDRLVQLHFLYRDG